MIYWVATSRPTIKRQEHQTDNGMCAHTLFLEGINATITSYPWVIGEARIHI